MVALVAVGTARLFAIDEGDCFGFVDGEGPPSGATWRSSPDPFLHSAPGLEAAKKNEKFETALVLMGQMY